MAAITPSSSTGGGQPPPTSNGAVTTRATLVAIDRNRWSRSSVCPADHARRIRLDQALPVDRRGRRQEPPPAVRDRRRGRGARRRWRRRLQWAAHACNYAVAFNSSTNNTVASSPVNVCVSFMLSSLSGTTRVAVTSSVTCTSDHLYSRPSGSRNPSSLAGTDGFEIFTSSIVVQVLTVRSSSSAGPDVEPTQVDSSSGSQPVPQVSAWSWQKNRRARQSVGWKTPVAVTTFAGQSRLPSPSYTPWASI